MKTRRKLLITVTCLVLVLAFSFSAFAASKTFFTRKVNSHNCTGTGSISGSTATATFRAIALPGELIQPDEAYSCKVSITAYNNAGTPLKTVIVYGTTNATATVNASTTIHRTENSFIFTGNNLGNYKLYA